MKTNPNDADFARPGLKGIKIRWKMFFKQKKDWQDAPTDKTGLTKFIVANDLHIGSKYQDNPNALQELSKLENDGRTVLNGDIFDRACAKPKDLMKLNVHMQYFINKFNRFYIMGNHERNGADYSPLKLSARNGLMVGFAHGDLISDHEKWFDYRKKKLGASLLGLLITSIFDNLDHLKAMRPLPKQFLPNAYAYCAAYGLDVLVLGHFHPEEERRYTVNGKLIIILPAHRINEVWI